MTYPRDMIKLSSVGLSLPNGLFLCQTQRPSCLSCHCTPLQGERQLHPRTCSSHGGLGILSVIPSPVSGHIWSSSLGVRANRAAQKGCRLGPHRIHTWSLPDRTRPWSRLPSPFILAYSRLLKYWDGCYDAQYPILRFHGASWVEPLASN